MNVLSILVLSTLPFGSSEGTSDVTEVVYGLLLMVMG